MKIKVVADVGNRAFVMVEHPVTSREILQTVPLFFCDRTLSYRAIIKVTIHD